MAQRNKVGHYDIVAELGRGGMGVVYKGYEASLNRHVAIKMLSEALADDASVVERFFREARSMAQLNDPHIVQIYLVGEDQGQPYFAMEFVEGESLSGRLKRERRLAPMEAARILLQVAQGLAAAHDRGVIHRDIKPANLLITQRGVVKVADFGIALATQDFNKKLTGTGQFVGTPGYLSPEVCLGKPVDQRSDVFALGIVFFEMLTGQTPYKDESPLGMMLEVVQAEIPDVRQINESVDPALSAILRRMVAKEPADRYSDCHQLIADLVAVGVNSATPVTPSKPLSNPALGTVVNAPTPPEMRRLQTPAPVAAPPAYRTEPSAQVAQPAPPAAPVAPPRKTAVLPWAAAALALIGGGGAAAWYYGGLKEQFQGVALSAPASNAPVATAPASAPTVTAAPATSAAPSTPPATPATDATAAVTPASSPAEPAPAVDPPTPPPATTPALASTPATTTTADSGTAAAPVAPVEAPPVAVATASTAPVEAPAQMGDRASAPPSQTRSKATPLDERIADLRERRLENRAGKGLAERPAQVARASVPPPATPAYNGPPRVIVIGVGDPAVAGVAEIAIEERLSESSVQLIDEDLLRGLSENDEPRRMLGAIGRNAEYLVLVRAVPDGSQTLTFYGQSVPQYNTILQVAVYDVHAGQKLGSGWQTRYSFTHLNAEENTRDAIKPYLARVLKGIETRRG
ncbi:MAG: serine/threonine-protein kinase [Lysobacterales bacterium]